MNSRGGTWFRRLARALATAQIAVYAALPFAEARLERAPGPVTVEARHSTDCVPAHDPLACLFCQVGVVRAEAGGTSGPPAPVEAHAPLDPAATITVVGRAPRLEPPSRAPPTTLA